MKHLTKSITWAIFMTLAAVSCTTGCSSEHESSDSDTSAEQAVVDETTAETTLAATMEAATEITEVSGLSSLLPLTRAEYDDDDMTWRYDHYDAEITLSDDNITVTGEDTSGVQVSGNQVTISRSGVYYLTGQLSDGQISVTGEDKVKLYLDGVSVTSTSGAALDCTNQKRTILSLAPSSENTFTEQFSCVGDVTEDIAAIYAKDKLTINGTGSLNVCGTTGNGILCQDDLKITGGTIQVSAASNGVKGTESVSVYDGDITIESGNDGIKSTKSDDTEKGWVAIDGGTFRITAGGDGIQAKTTLEIASGDLYVETIGEVSPSNNNNNPMGGGFGHGGFGRGGDMTPPDGFEGGFGRGDDMVPPDGFEGGLGRGDDMALPDGFEGGFGHGGDMPPQWNGENMQPPENMPFEPFDSSDAESNSDSDDISSKGLKSGGDMTVIGGNIHLTTTDHSVHAGGDMTISGGTWQVASSVGKGFSAHGNLEISGTDTAITIDGCTEGIESKMNMTISGGSIRILNATDDGVNAGQTLTISGGTVYINSLGDGFDANGTANLDGGTLIISGPVSGGDGSFDCDGAITYSGGLMLGLSSNGMMEFPETGCMVTTGASAAAGEIIAVLDEQGQVLIAVQSEKAVTDVIFSVSSEQADMTRCRLVTGCTYDGTFNEDGWAVGGSISGGTAVDWTEASESAIAGGMMHGQKGGRHF